jgi:hypothetical protein
MCVAPGCRLPQGSGNGVEGLSESPEGELAATPEAPAQLKNYWREAAKEGLAALAPPLPNARDSMASGAREATSALNGQPTLPLPEFLPMCREKLPRLYR